jgi:hypothetical protein
VLEPCDEGYEVPDDRSREHPGQKRPAIGVEAEVEDRTRGDGLLKVDLLRPFGWVKPGACV